MEVCWPLSLRCSQLCCRFLSPCKTVDLTAALPQVSCGGFLPAATRGWGSVPVLVIQHIVPSRQATLTQWGQGGGGVWIGWGHWGTRLCPGVVMVRSQTFGSARPSSKLLLPSMHLGRWTQSSFIIIRCRWDIDSIIGGNKVRQSIKLTYIQSL